LPTDICPKVCQKLPGKIDLPISVP